MVGVTVIDVIAMIKVVGGEYQKAKQKKKRADVFDDGLRLFK